MRVLLAGRYPDQSGSTIGGPQTVTSVLAEEFARGPDIEPIVITCTSGWENGVFEQDGIPVHRVPISRTAAYTGYWVEQRRLRSKIAEICPDIVHAQGTGFYSLAASESGFPAVTTIHGIFLRESDYMPAKRLQDRLARSAYIRMNKRSLAKATHIITISPYTWSSIGRFSKAETHEIGIPIRRVYFEQEYSPDEGRILCVGAVFRRKGIVFLVRALDIVAKRHPRVCLSIVGKVVDEDYYREVMDYTGEHGLVDNIKWLGQMDPVSLAKEYSSSAIFALPSLEENTPGVISEAMAVGCPVVATAVGGVPWMVDDTGLLVEPGNPVQLAEAILRLLEDHSLRESMSERGKEIARDRYAPWSVAAKTIEVYQEILGATAGKV